MNWVYFCGFDRSHVKIGVTGNVQRRIRQLAAGSAATLSEASFQFLVAVVGNGDDERKVQTYFLAEQLKGECYRPSARLMAYVRWLRDQYFATVEMSDLIADAVPYDFWAPGRGREKYTSDLFRDDPWHFPMPEYNHDDYHTPAGLATGSTHDVMSPVWEFYDGEIDLDPASHPVANRGVRAKRIYTVQDNGLMQQWNGKLWINPPFSIYAEFAAKFEEEWRSGRVTEALLYHSDRHVSSKYFQPLLTLCAAKVVIAGRIHHGGIGDEVKQPAPPSGYGILYFGKRVDRFKSIFQRLGTVWVPA